MKIRDIGGIISKLKINHKRLFTNIIWSSFQEDQEVDEVYQSYGGVVFVVSRPNRKTAYYSAANEDELVLLLAKVRTGVVLEYHYRKENDMESIFERANMQYYATYFRVTTIFKESPYGRETGRRAILNELYDPNCGEYPNAEDAAELMKLTEDIFDPLTDDIFTMQEWQAIIRRKECLVIKEDGKIVSYYVWRLEGKKLYSNLSLNLGPANYMYNLERVVFERMWQAGIRIFYAWYNSSNYKSVTRNSLKADMGDLFDAFYVKS